MSRPNSNRNSTETFNVDDLAEKYTRDAEAEISEGLLNEKITPEQVETFAAAPDEHEVSLENMHKPTKKEVAASIIKSITETNNTKITITTLAELKDYEATLDKSESTDDWARDAFVSFGTRKTDVTIAPKVFFEFIKGSITEVHADNLEKRLKGFKQIFDVTAKTGQLALHENACDEIIKLVKEQEASACGYSTYVEEKSIKLFLREVEGRVAYFKDFKDFPRLVPDAILQKLSEAQDKNIFEQFWILYLDHTKDSANIKSNSTKVKDKDPILFGRLTGDSSKYFYIADWIDEYCDLTLDKFVETLQEIDSSYTLPEVALPTPLEIGALLKEKNRRSEVLRSTNSSNYRELSAKEAKRQNPDGSKKGYFKRFITEYFTL